MSDLADAFLRGKEQRLRQQNFMQSLQEYRDRQEEEEARLTAAGKSADAFAQAVPEFLKEVGTAPDAWKNLGAREKAAMMDGYVTAQKFKEFKGRLLDYAQQQDLRERTAADFTGYMRELPVAQEMAPLDRRLSEYYEADSAEMPNKPTRALAEYAPELSAKYPLAARDPQLNDYLKLLVPAGGTGASWNLTPNSISDLGGVKRLAVSPNSFQVIAPVKAEKETAQNYPWLLSDEEDEFKQGIKGIADPAERDRALTARALYNRALGKADPLAELIGSLVHGGARSASPKPSGKAGQPLDNATATKILKEAGGDKAKARQLARERGYSF